MEFGSGAFVKKEKSWSETCRSWVKKSRTLKTAVVIAAMAGLPFGFLPASVYAESSASVPAVASQNPDNIPLEQQAAVDWVNLLKGVDDIGHSPTLIEPPKWEIPVITPGVIQFESPNPDSEEIPPVLETRVGTEEEENQKKQQSRTFECVSDSNAFETIVGSPESTSYIAANMSTVCTKTMDRIQFSGYVHYSTEVGSFRSEIVGLRFGVDNCTNTDRCTFQYIFRTPQPGVYFIENLHLATAKAEDAPSTDSALTSSTVIVTNLP